MKRKGKTMQETCEKGPIRILHTSDLHGDFSKVLEVDEDFDLWLDTGDFMPNHGRTPDTDFKINLDRELFYQHAWLARRKVGYRLREWLDERPVITVAGNHDFVRLHQLLESERVPNLFEITPSGFELFGMRWAGFREIPYIRGEWVGEAQTLRPEIEHTWLARPHILVTHTPRS